MPKLLCLAQHDPPAKRKAKGTKPDPAAAPRYTIIERVPIRLAAHKIVWDALRKHAEQQPIIDAAHPQDQFAAGVIAIDKLSKDATRALAEILNERRAMTVGASKDVVADDILAKHLDRLFEQEMEWLAIRNLLATALRPTRATARRKPARALLLVDA